MSLHKQFSIFCNGGGCGTCDTTIGNLTRRQAVKQFKKENWIFKRTDWGDENTFCSTSCLDTIIT